MGRTTTKQAYQYIEKHIPELLLSKRKKSGLTLQELADISGLSPAFVSQAERGKTVPSIISLLSLAEALDTDISYFLPTSKPKSTIRRTTEPFRLEINSPVIYHRLDGELRDQRIGVLHFEIPPGYHLPKAHRNRGETFYYVLGGEISVEIGDENHYLHEGDSIHFDATIDHNVANMGTNSSMVLGVHSPILFK